MKPPKFIKETEKERERRDGGQIVRTSKRERGIPKGTAMAIAQPNRIGNKGRGGGQGKKVKPQGK